MKRTLRKMPPKNLDTTDISTKILYAITAVFCFSAFLIISYKLWENDLRLWGQHYYIPDGYGYFAMRWNLVISDPSIDSLNKLAQWSAGYYQASNWLTAFLVGLVMVLTGSTHYGTLYAFFLVSGMASGVTAYYLYRYLKEFVGLRDRQCLIMLILFWSHVVIMFSLIRPQTDVLLLAFITTSLYFVTKLFINKNINSLKSYIVVVIIFSFGIMVKLSFSPMLVTPLFAWILLRFFNINSHKNPGPTPLWGVTFISIPLLFWLIYMSSLNLFPTLSKQAETLNKFGYDYNPESFLLTLMVVGQGYLWFLSGIKKRERLFNPIYLIPLVWSIGYVSFLIIAGVPFWNRHFLPIIPVLFILSAKNIERYMESKRFWWGLPLFFLLLNHLIIFRIFIVNEVASSLVHFFYG